MPDQDIQFGRTRGGASTLPEAKSLARGDTILVLKGDGWHRVPLARLIDLVGEKVATSAPPAPASAPESQPEAEPAPSEPDPADVDPPPSDVPKKKGRRRAKK